MKQLLFIALLIAPIFVSAQYNDDKPSKTSEKTFMQELLFTVFPVTDGKVLYQGVVNFDSTITPNQIHKNAISWFANSFKSGKDVLQINDKDNGIVMGRGFWEHPSGNKFWFDIKVEIKDNRFRCTLTDIRRTFNSYISNYGNLKVDQSFEEFITSIDGNNMSKKKKEKMTEAYSEIEKHFKSVFISFKNSLTKKEEVW